MDIIWGLPNGVSQGLERPKSLICTEMKTKINLGRTTRPTLRTLKIPPPETCYQYRNLTTGKSPRLPSLAQSSSLLTSKTCIKDNEDHRNASRRLCAAIRWEDLIPETYFSVTQGLQRPCIQFNSINFNLEIYLFLFA